MTGRMKHTICKHSPPCRDADAHEFQVGADKLAEQRQAARREVIRLFPALVEALAYYRPGAALVRKGRKIVRVLGEP